MEIENLIQALYNNRKIDSKNQFKIFQASIEELANYSIPSHLLPQLMRVLDDSCESYEVMYGLIHLIESTGDEYISILVQNTSDLYPHAKRWLQTLYIAILNDEKSTLVLKNILKDSHLINEPLRSIFSMIVKRNPNRFESKVKALMEL